VNAARRKKVGDVSRLLAALAVIVLIAGGALTLTAYVGAEDHESELIVVLLLGMPAAALSLYLGSMAFLLSRRRAHVIRPALLALIGSLVTPLALYGLWQGADLASLLSLVVGFGAFMLFFSDLRAEQDRV
jgi:hypothetical protein